jgi:hypothetical protein
VKVTRRSCFGGELFRGATLSVLRTATLRFEAHIDRTPAAPPKQKGIVMRIIAKVIESMLRKDATQTWNGQTSAVASRDIWGWGGFS